MFLVLFKATEPGLNGGSLYCEGLTAGAADPEEVDLVDDIDDDDDDGDDDDDDDDDRGLSDVGWDLVGGISGVSWRQF